MCMQVTHETERTDFWSKSSIGTRFTTGGSQVDDFDFVGILENREISQKYRPKRTEILAIFGAIVASCLMRGGGSGALWTVG